MIKNLIKNFLGIEEGCKAVGTITIKTYKAGTKELLSTMVQKNLIMQSSNHGKSLLVDRLIGNTLYTTIINYGAIGTSATPVAISDTQLGAEIARATVAFSQNTSNTTAVLQFFFADANLANGTYYEFGTFIDGTAVANSGQLFNHALFASAYTKAAGTDVTVEVDIVFT